MLLYEKIEYAKDLANKKKFKEALKEFQFLAGHVQSKDIENINCGLQICCLIIIEKWT